MHSRKGKGKYSPRSCREKRSIPVFREKWIYFRRRSRKGPALEKWSYERPVYYVYLGKRASTYSEKEVQGGCLTKGDSGKGKEPFSLETCSCRRNRSARKGAPFHKKKMGFASREPRSADWAEPRFEGGKRAFLPREGGRLMPH